MASEPFLFILVVEKSSQVVKTVVTCAAGSDEKQRAESNDIMLNRLSQLEAQFPAPIYDVFLGKAKDMQTLPDSFSPLHGWDEVVKEELTT